MPSDYCTWCDRDAHRCVGCGDPLQHYECGHVQFGWCEDCYMLQKARG